MDTRAVAKYKQDLYRIIAEDEGQQALQELAPIILPLSDREKNTPQIELQCNRLIPLIFSSYNFIRVLGISPDDDTIYYKRASEPLYQPLQSNTLRELIIAAYNDTYHRRPSGDKIKTIGETLKSWVEEKRDGLDTSIIQVAPSLFWDLSQAALTEAPDRPCFRRLFDQIANDTLTVDINKINQKHIQAVYKETLRLLEKNDGALIPHELDEDASTVLSHQANPLNPFWVWANGNLDTFNDLLKASATIFMENKPKGAFILIGSSRNGKSNLSNTTQVLVRDVNNPIIPHWKEHGKIIPGDEVLSWRGSFCKVVATVKHPAGPFYRLTLQDGRTIEAGEDHLWSVVPKARLHGHRPRVRDEHGHTTDKRYSVPIERYDPDMWVTKSTKELLQDYRGQDKISKEGWTKKQCKYYIPPAQPAILPEQTFPIDPYILGVIIGDAHVTPSGYVTITGMDPELIEAVTGQPAKVDEKRTARSKMHTTNYMGRTATHKEALTELGLLGKRSYEKFIPPEYLLGSIEQRYALLRGLLDTDGTISHGRSNSGVNQVELSTASKCLAEQVRSLVFSLGGSATVHERMGRYRLPDGTYKTTRPNYRLFIRTLENPFHLSRKADCWHPQKWLGYTAIANIEYIGEQEAQCIAIDGDEQTYLATENYIPTHNTYLKLLHTMLGRHNTSALKLTDLNAPRLNLTLLTSMMNAPDEEDEGRSQQVLENQSFFKSIASHEPVLLEVMYSKEPQWVSTNFPSFYPMNDLPQWQGTGAEACMRRSLVIRFTNDLSRFDNGGRNFEKETYTAEYYAPLLGVLLAFATYYNTREMSFSDTMAQSISDVAEEVDSLTTYLKLFRKHFDAFSSAALVWEDYRLWCEERDLQWSGKRVLFKKLRFYNLTSTRLAVSLESSEEYASFQTFVGNGREIAMERRFHPGTTIDVVGGATVEYLHTEVPETPGGPLPRRARSVVAILEDYENE